MTVTATCVHISFLFQLQVVPIIPNSPPTRLVTTEGKSENKNKIKLLANIKSKMIVFKILSVIPRFSFKKIISLIM